MDKVIQLSQQLQQVQQDISSFNQILSQLTSKTQNNLSQLAELSSTEYNTANKLKNFNKLSKQLWSSLKTCKTPVVVFPATATTYFNKPGYINTCISGRISEKSYTGQSWPQYTLSQSTSTGSRKRELCLQSGFGQHSTKRLLRQILIKIITGHPLITRNSVSIQCSRFISKDQFNQYRTSSYNQSLDSTPHKL